MSQYAYYYNIFINIFIYIFIYIYILCQSRFLPCCEQLSSHTIRVTRFNKFLFLFYNAYFIITILYIIIYLTQTQQCDDRSNIIFCISTISVLQICTNSIEIRQKKKKKKWYYTYATARRTVAFIFLALFYLNDKYEIHGLTRWSLQSYVHPFSWQIVKRIINRQSS